MAAEEYRMDALPGGERLPSSLTVSKFVACRSQEIQMMKHSLLIQSGTKLAFQTLPKHMRRRAMSHNVKRLPRRMRQIHLNQMKKSGLPTKQKRPSRKYRRRPRNLTEEYTKRASKKYKWLQTHIWHAKRFHMVEKWGYKLPYEPCDKAFRACYRAMTQHCLLQDISYFSCIEIAGNKNLIVETFKQLWKPDGRLSVGAKAFINGNREGELTLYEVDEPRTAIGDVNFQWQPNSEISSSKLWFWIHPALYRTVKSELRKCFERFPDIVSQELCTELCRFRLTGPLANSVLHDTLSTVKFDNSNLFESYLGEYFAISNIEKQCECWSNTRTTDVPPHSIVSLIVKDPRLLPPKKRTKSVPEFQDYVFHDLPSEVADSPLWDEKFRKRVNASKISDLQVTELQSELLVPETELRRSEVAVPVILIQKPGNKRENLGMGSGWDLILPSAWAKTFWVAMVMCGARVGGLREASSMLFEMGKSQFLQPDTQAGVNEDLQESTRHIQQFFRRPPNKRINYNKFKIVSPFTCSWKLLLKEWNSTEAFQDTFTILKDKNILSSVQDFLSSKTNSPPNCPSNCLIPVRLECGKRGCPSQFAIICLPKSNNDFKNVPAESNCEDKLQIQRKELRRAHQSMLKKFRKQRRIKSGCVDPDEYKSVLMDYTQKIRALWLPEATNVRNSCSREVMGFVTKGGFSFSQGKSGATGYITSDCLPALVNFRNKVLCRNTASKLYKVVNLFVVLE